MRKQLNHIKQHLILYRNLGFSLLIIFIFFLLFHSATNWCNYQNFFALDSAIIKGNYLVAKNHIIKTGNIHKNMNVLATDCKQIRTNLETHPYVKAAIVSKRYPNKLFINIKERMPIAYLNAGNLLLIDKEGIVLPVPDKVIRNQLPVITVAPDSAYKVIPGQSMESPEINQITKLMIDTFVLSRPLYNVISEIRYNLDTAELILFNKDTGYPIYFGNNNFKKKIHSLAKFQRILSGKKRLSDYRYIDLRWNRQIVVKEI